MIFPNSRYANSALATIEAPAVFGSGDVSVIVPGQATAYSFTYVTYQTRIGDRIDGLAYQFYTDATLWWRIAQANPEILWWDNLTPGTVIRIPHI